MFGSQVNVSVKVKTEGHPRFNTAGKTTAFAENDRISVIFDEDGVTESIAVTDLQAL